MKYEIYSYRYVNEMSYVKSVKTHAEACAEIDRLARLEAAPKSFLGQLLHGDKVYYTFLPVGTAEY